MGESFWFGKTRQGRPTTIRRLRPSHARSERIKQLCVIRKNSTRIVIVGVHVRCSSLQPATRTFHPALFDHVTVGFHLVGGGTRFRPPGFLVHTPAVLRGCVALSLRVDPVLRTARNEDFPFRVLAVHFNGDFSLLKTAPDCGAKVHKRLIGTKCWKIRNPPSQHEFYAER